MEIELITIGKTSIGFVKSGISEYMDRLRHYIPFKLTELTDIKKGKNVTPESQKELEGEMILSKVSLSDYVILLDEKGKEFTSMAFSSFIGKLMISGRKRVIFIVGGPYGFSKKIYDRADFLLSLSKMTFNHEMVRMFFIEQVYRAMTIQRGEPYHHE